MTGRELAADRRRGRARGATACSTGCSGWRPTCGSAGVEIALAEVLDAAEALRHVDVGRRPELRAALRCVLVKYPHHDARFDAAFDRAFPARASGSGPPGRPRRRGRCRRGDRMPEGGGTLDTRVREAVDGATLDDLRILAEQAVDEHGGFDEGVRTERYHVYRVLRAIDLARLLHDAVRRARERGEAVDRRRGVGAGRGAAAARHRAGAVAARRARARRVWRSTSAPSTSTSCGRRPRSSTRCARRSARWCAAWRRGCASAARAPARDASTCVERPAVRSPPGACRSTSSTGARGPTSPRCSRCATSRARSPTSPGSRSR